MTEFNLLDYDGISLYSNCLVYENENKIQVHLLPVIHIGELEYYTSLLNYIQNRVCIFEKINLAPSDITLEKSVESLDEYLEIAVPATLEFWDQYHELLKRFYKKFITRDVKSLCKKVRKQIKNFDDNIKTIYDSCVKSGFGIQNLHLVQLYLCEIMNLKHQMIAIDYINDIPHRSNWIHTDLDFGNIAETVNLNELLEEILIEPSPEILEMLRIQIKLLLTNILGLVKFKLTPEISSRRELLANGLIQLITQQFEEIIDTTPNYILEGRNSIVQEQILNLIKDHKEIVVFYGVAHMVAIEKFIQGQGFRIKTQHRFEAFKIGDN